MRIEVGKKYINAIGDIAEIITYDKVSSYPYGDNQGIDYTISGNIWRSKKPHEKDLICEVNEDLYTAYEQDLITEYEFLNKHFELYSGVTLERYNQLTKD